METVIETRLPTTVRPKHYALTLTPDLLSATFTGEAVISVEVASPTSRIVLHALELEVQETVMRMPDGKPLRAQDVTFDDIAETATLSFPEPLPAGPATLTMRFSGILNDQLRGFYRSAYGAPDGSERYLATTQFEATDARRCFPCWDEPAVKATFQVTLIIPKDLVALSNTEVETETPADGGKKTVRFSVSPLMSTYLLAFVIGDMASVQAPAANGTLIRVWTTRGKEQQGQFALDNAVRLLAFYNDYFDIPYPLKKLDHIAIPDFAAGAMENWGCITYRETALLFDPANSAAGTRQRILEVVAHEMAHMWFGDLVTMEWWDDLWLNESFATWMGDKAVDHLYPEWNMWTQFVSHDTNNGLSLDGLRNSHPIEVPVADPNQIRELFDAISYSKGGAVLRMLENYLGDTIFRTGLRRYIAQHAYGNARTEDLWSALAAASGEPVSEVMATWIKQTGYPVVSAERAADGTQLQLSQRRFLYDHLMDPEELDSTLWKIPVHIAYQNETQQTALLQEERTVQAPARGTPDGWVKLNAGQAGFYRANYSRADWERLQDAVARRALPAIDRLGLQGDAYALARGGYLPATVFLALAEVYRPEDDAIVWGDVAGNLAGVENLILNEPFLPVFDRFARDLFKDIASKVGWEPRSGEGHLDALLRSTALGSAGAYGDPEVLAQAKARFEAYMRDTTKVHPDLRGIVVGLTAQQGDAALYEVIWERAKQAELQEEKLRFLRALGRFPQTELLETTLQRSLSSDVRVGDAVQVIGSVAGNRKGRPLVWDFIRANWDELDRRYGRGGFAITSLVALTGGFTSLDKAKEVEEFFATHPAPSAARTIQQSLERIRLNNRWLEQNRPALAEWFSAGR